MLILGLKLEAVKIIWGLQCQDPKCAFWDRNLLEARFFGSDTSASTKINFQSENFR